MTAHLLHALLMITFGNMMFEQVYRFDEATKRFRLHKHAPRMPGIISEIQVARDDPVPHRCKPQRTRTAGSVSVKAQKIERAFYKSMLGVAV